jgi:hypothetical protein
VDAQEAFGVLGRASLFERLLAVVAAVATIAVIAALTPVAVVAAWRLLGLGLGWL